MQAAIVASPVGDKVIVSQVVLGDGADVWTLRDGQPAKSAVRSYPSLDDAAEQNTRATTASWIVDVADDEEAIALLGGPPPGETKPKSLDEAKAALDAALDDLDDLGPDSE